LNGNLLVKFGEIGLGPKEFKKISDFDIDSATNRVVIFSTENRSLYYYAADNGSFIKKKKIGFYGRSIALLPQGRILLYKNYATMGSGDDNNLILFDSNANIVGKYLHFNPKISNMGWSFTGFLSRTNGEVLLTTAFGDTIFKYDNGRLKPYLALDINSGFIRDNKFDHRKIFFSKKLTDTETSFLRNSFLKTDNCIVLNFQAQQTVRIAIYDIKKQGISILKEENDPLISLIQDPLYLSSKDTLIYSLSKEQILDMKKSNPEKLAGLSLENRQAIDSITEMSGECLLFSKIR